MSLVSVIIPAFNQAHYVGEAMRSVIDQTYTDLEIILVDDGSTDDTEAVAKKMNDGRLKYVYQENQGLSAARNKGILCSTGEYISYLDSDDMFLPGKLELLVEALEKEPAAGLAAGKAQPIDEGGNFIGRVFDKPLPTLSAALLLNNPLHVGSVVVRRSWQEKVGFFDEELRSYEDWDMWIRLGLAGCRSVWVPQLVSLYRFHEAQMTRIGSQMTAATFAVLDKLFGRSDLPSDWAALEKLAYSRAHLRAAAQAYWGQNYGLGGSHLRKAVKNDPSLTEDGGELLIDQFCAWAELPKIREPIVFLERVFSNLPSELAPLATERRRRLGRVASQYVFVAYSGGDWRRTRSYALKAVLYDPFNLMNRGLVSLLVQSLFHK